MQRPKYLSKAKVTTRAKTGCLTIQGKGDPIVYFDKKIAEIYDWVERNSIKISDNPPFGVYYRDRLKVGVENVIWDACVPVREKIESPFKFKVFSSKKVLSTILTGGYDLIGDGIDYLESFAKKKSLKLTWPLVEVYIKEGENPVTKLLLFISG